MKSKNVLAALIWAMTGIAQAAFADIASSTKVEQPQDCMCLWNFSTPPNFIINKDGSKTSIGECEVEIYTYTYYPGPTH